MAVNRSRMMSNAMDIHQSPPPYVDQRPTSDLFITGLKVLDLLAAIRARWQSWAVGRRRRWQDSAHHGNDPAHFR